MRKTQLKSMKEEIHKVLSDAKVMAFVQVVRRHEKATLGDVMALSEEMGLTGMNINQLLFEGLPRDGKAWAKKMRALSVRTRQRSGVDTRTAKGRETYDNKVLKEVLRTKAWKSAIDIREAVGGNPDQARRSLNRLIECGRINFTGKARATRYRGAQD